MAIHDVYMDAPLFGAKCTPRMLALSEVIETTEPEKELGRTLTDNMSESVYPDLPGAVYLVDLPFSCYREPYAQQDRWGWLMRETSRRWKASK